MNKLFSTFIIAVLTVTFLFALSGTLHGAIQYGVHEEHNSTILTAEKTNETITVDGSSNESSWATIPILYVTAQDGSIGPLDIALKALYDSDYIYIFATWSDPTKSVEKKLWTYNGTNWTKSGDEDRFAIFWNIDDSVNGFNIGGCAMLCHGDRMHTNAPEEKADEWHWKAARTNPAGYADDKFINSTVVGYGENEFGVPTEWTGRHSDPKISGGYKDNINEEKTSPRYYEPNPTDIEDARFIFKGEIDNGEAVEISSETMFQKGDTLPGYILEKPIGSRGDIEAKGAWNDGVWNLEIKRKFNTEHDDDVVFDVTKTYRFGVAVMDDTGGFEGFGKGHSFTLGASTLEFGGFGSETVTQLALIREYLITAHTYLENDRAGLGISTIIEARSLYTDIAHDVSDVDPAMHIKITTQFESARRNPTLELIDGLMEELNDASLVVQGKREPKEPTFGVKILSVWGGIQVYVFIILSIAVLYPLYKTAMTARKPELRRLGIFMFIVITPVFFEGFGRLGILLHISLLQKFSFTTNEYATLLWAVAMAMAMVIARFGFKDVDVTISSLRDYTSVLSESEERHRTLVESSTDAIISIDESKKIYLWNDAAEKIVGYTEDEVLGKSIEIIVPEKYRDAHSKGIKRFLKTGKPKVIGKTVEVEAKRKDGKIIPIELALSTAKLKGKNVFTGIIRDISKRKKAEEKLKKYSAQLENSNRLKDLFTDIMRHDLLNPAGVARTMTELALEMEEDTDRKEPLQLVLDSSNRIIDMIEHASTLAKLESGERQKFEEADLGVILRKAVKEMTPLADEKKTKIKIVATGMFPARVTPLIQDVFSNLISNSIKYGPEDSDVVVRIDDEGTNWKISVTDKGEGIPNEDKDDIFVRFKRLKKGAVKGTGLGLAIVKRVVDAHKGRVWVEDNPKGGSIFYVTIPKSRVGLKK